MAAEAVSAALERHALAVVRGENPYEASSGGIPLDALFDDDEFADPHAPLPEAPGSSGTKRPTRDASGRIVIVDASDLPEGLPRVEVTNYSWSQARCPPAEVEKLRTTRRTTHRLR